MSQASKLAFVPERLTSTLHASILSLGPLVAGFWYAKLSLPGGRSISSRPVDEYVRGLEVLGVRVCV